MYKDREGRWRTESLFKETCSAAAKANGYSPVFTLKEVDPDGLPSMRKHFILSEDPTGYTTAKELLGSWSHWQKIFANKRFKEELDAWQEELDVRLRSKAIKAIKDTALTEGSKGTTAAKYLADGAYRGTKRGRPSKEDVARETRIQAGLSRELAEDEERVLRLAK